MIFNRIFGSTFCAINVTYPSGSICTCTHTNGLVLTAGDTTGQWVFFVPYDGTWTVSYKNGEKKRDEILELDATHQNKIIELDFYFTLFDSAGVQNDVYYRQIESDFTMIELSGANASNIFNDKFHNILDVNKNGLTMSINRNMADEQGVYHAFVQQAYIYNNIKYSTSKGYLTAEIEIEDFATTIEKYGVLEIHILNDIPTLRSGLSPSDLANVAHPNGYVEKKIEISRDGVYYLDISGTSTGYIALFSAFPSITTTHNGYGIQKARIKRIRLV